MFGFITNSETGRMGFFFPWWLTLPRTILGFLFLPFIVALILIGLLGYMTARIIRYYQRTHSG